MPPELLGPLGLLVAAVAAVSVLWKEHLRADADDRTQRDTALRLLESEQTIVRKLLERKHVPPRRPRP